MARTGMLLCGETQPPAVCQGTFMETWASQHPGSARWPLAGEWECRVGRSVRRVRASALCRECFSVAKPNVGGRPCLASNAGLCHQPPRNVLEPQPDSEQCR